MTRESHDLSPPLVVRLRMAFVLMTLAAVLAWTGNQISAMRSRERERMWREYDQHMSKRLYGNPKVDPVIPNRPTH